MAILMGDLRAALIEAGASEELADKAAVELATHRARLAGFGGRLMLLICMVAAAFALSIAILCRVFQ